MKISFGQWHFLHLLSHVYGLRTEAPPFRQTPLLLLRELWCHNSGESPSWSHGMFLVAKKQDRGKPEGWMKKTHHCSLDVHVCVLGRRWLQRGICDKTGVCRHHFLLLQLCNHKPLIPVPSPTRIMQILDFTANHHQKLPCDQVHAVSTHKALQRPLMLWTEMKVWTSQSVNIFPKSNYEVLETGDHLAVTSTGRKYF